MATPPKMTSTQPTAVRPQGYPACAITVGARLRHLELEPPQETEAGEVGVGEHHAKQGPDPEGLWAEQTGEQNTPQAEERLADASGSSRRARSARYGSPAA